MNLPASTSTAGKVALGAGLGAFVLYAWCAAPTAFWLDSSELAAGAFELGVTHPPGHPFYALAAKLATLLPFGTIAFRVHVFCAALMGVAVAFGVRAAVALATSVGLGLGDDGARGGLRAGAATPALAIAALSTPFWFHGVRAEVYPLHLVTAAAIVWLAALIAAEGDDEAGRRRAGRLLIVLAFATGLGLANHHYLVVFLAPGVVWMVAASRAGRWALLRRLPHAAAALAYGLLPYLLMPLRSSPALTVRWGEPETPSGFWWLLSAQAFQRATTRSSGIEPSVIIGNIGLFMSRHVGELALGLAALGLALLARRRPAVAVGLALVMVCNILSQALMDFDPNNPDVAGYWLITSWLVAVLGGVGLIALAGWARAQRPARWLALTLLVAVPLTAIAVALPPAIARADLSDERGTDVVAESLYAVIPTDGVLVASYFQTSFNLWYRDAVAAMRPDVAIVHRLFRTYPGYDEAVRARYPWVAGLLEAPAETAELSVPWVLDRAASGGVFVELEPPEAGLRTPGNLRLREHLVPAGLLLRVAPFVVPPGPFPPGLVAADERFWADLAARLDMSVKETADNLAWVHFNRVHLHLERRQLDAAEQHLEQTQAIVGGRDPELDALRAELERLRSEH